MRYILVFYPGWVGCVVCLRVREGTIQIEAKLEGNSHSNCKDANFGGARGQKK